MQSPCESWHLHVLKKATCYKTTYKSYSCQFSSLGDINDISCILFLYKMDFYSHLWKKTTQFHAQLFTSQPQALLLLNTDEILTFLWYPLTFRELAVRQFSSISAKGRTFTVTLDQSQGLKLCKINSRPAS